ncbi:MAG: hypothetical protein B0A82_24480 [Alkalinema sp. CACIAM 70d]|nr:MAG: hypothetical protein B0A82_24480 [Alkalinema sp. CACIAM 70d]
MKYYPNYPINQPVSLSIAFLLMVGSVGGVIVTADKTTAQTVVAVTGKIEWKPPGGTRFNPVSKNMTLLQGSLLRLSQGATVTISCPDGRSSPWSTQGTAGLTQICPPARTISGRSITPRNGGAQDIPYTILPRATEILTPQPILRWNAATGTNSFTLTVRGDGLSWTQKVKRANTCQEQTCEFVYPGQPTLQPSVAYRFVIDADNGRSSSEESTAGLGFKLLDATLATEVREVRDRIITQNLPEPSNALAIANLYTSYNLIAEALQTLEAIPTTERTAEVHRLLGDLYRQIGLSQEAEVQYLAAIQQAKTTNNPFELAAAQSGLGEVNYALGRRETAVQLLQSAKRGYEALGDVEQVTRLKKRLMKIT